MTAACTLPHRRRGSLPGRRLRAVLLRAEGQHPQHAHLETRTRARRQRQVAAPGQRHLVPQLHQLGPEAGCQRIHVHAIGLHRAARHQLAHLDAVQGFGHGIQHAAPVGREPGQGLDLGQQGLAVASRERLQQRRHPGAIHGAQHRGYAGIIQPPAGVGDGLVQQRERITQAAIGGPGQLADGGGFGFDLLGAQDLPDLAFDLVQVQAFQIELQAARQHGHRQLLRIGGGQQELHVPGRLLQRLEQRVEGGLGEHVHLVDEVHLHPPARGHVLGVVDQFAHVIHAGVAGGVDLEQVDEAAGVDITAGIAFTAGLGRGALLAVQALGEDAGDGGLAHATGAGEQKRMVHAAGIQRVAEGPDHVLLADQFIETAGAPLAGEDEIGHAPILPCRPPLPAGSSCSLFRVVLARRIAGPASCSSASAQCGEVSEWLKEHAWKVCKRLNPLRGFESPSLRQSMVTPSVPRNARSKTPPGPEGSNGIGRRGCRGQLAGSSPFQAGLFCPARSGQRAQAGAPSSGCSQPASPST